MSIFFIAKGRSGNNLFQYFLLRLLSDKFNLKITQTFNSKLIDLKPNKNNFSKNNFLNKTVLINDDNWKQFIDTSKIGIDKSFILNGYFQDSEFFNNNCEKIISYVDLPILDKNNEDIVIHLRLGDFVKGNNILSPSWYKNILKNEKFDKLFIVIEKTNHNFEKEYLHKFQQWNPIIINNSEREDFDFIRSFNKIISSNSTFSWWACYFSEAQKIYTPSKWRNNKNLSNIRNKSIIIESYNLIFE